MQFDPSNKIIQYCAKGMEAEGQGNLAQAKRLFQEAWEQSVTNVEKFTAAHYMARHQEDVNEELKWNLESLRFAELICDDSMKSYFPSLHLNTGKSYEKLNATEKAKGHYESAAAYLRYLPDDGYGKMMRKGVEAAVIQADKGAH